MDPLYIVDFNKPYNVHGDSSNYAVGAIINQTDETALSFLLLLQAGNSMTLSVGGPLLKRILWCYAGLT